MPVGAGIAVAGVASGVASSRAASKAAKAGERGAERSGAQIQAAADLARRDVLDFFPAAQQDLLAGAGAAGNLLAQGIGEQQRLLSAGNVGAQGTLGTGFGQVQNALLGLPVNQQAFAPQQIPLSQIPQNPLAQRAAQSTGQQAQPSGLFSDVSQVQPSAQRERLSGITNNAGILNRVVSGELEFPGVDPGFISTLIQERDIDDQFLSSNALIDLATENSPASIEAFLGRTGLNAENRGQLRRLIAGLTEIRGT